MQFGHIGFVVRARPQGLADLARLWVSRWLQIWPLFFEMDSNEEIALNVSYEPTEWGNSEERMVLVCDNCQVGQRGMQAADGFRNHSRPGHLWLLSLPSMYPWLSKGSHKPSFCLGHLPAPEDVLACPLPHPRLIPRSPSRPQVKTFSLLGNAVAVDVTLHSVDGRMLEPRELDMPQWFGEVVPGSAFSKTVSVRNTTKLPFAFEWALSRWVRVALGLVVC